MRGRGESGERNVNGKARTGGVYNPNIKEILTDFVSLVEAAR
jgi:hypothetical protein